MKRHDYKRFTLLLSVVITVSLHASPNPLTLWYQQAAQMWEEAIPLGNGRMGAMVFGGAQRDHYQMNEETLWSGTPRDGNNEEAFPVLSLVREAVNKGDYKRAEILWKEHAQGPYSARYLPMGDLLINMHHDSLVSHYRRELDLRTAVNKVTYKVGKAMYERSTFISYPDQVMVIHLNKKGKGTLSFDIQLSSELRYELSSANGKELVLKGRAPIYVAARDYDPMQIVYDNQSGIEFEMRIRILEEDAKVTVKKDLLTVDANQAVTVLVASATNFDPNDPMIISREVSPTTKNLSTLSKLNGITYKKLLKNHLDDYQSLFGRVDLSLGKVQRQKELMPTDQRLVAFEKDDSVVVI